MKVEIEIALNTKKICLEVEIYFTQRKDVSGNQNVYFSTYISMNSYILVSKIKTCINEWID